MPAGANRARNVFINCPFDDDYGPILQAILFCLIDCDLSPRLATERLDSGEVRLDKIIELTKDSRFSIHDLSRVQSSEEGEYARLNMPFELGIHHGLRVSGRKRFADDRLLVIAEDRNKYRAALSDIAGWDIRSHDANFERAIRVVRGWLASHGLATRSPSTILGDYTGYQEWDYERLLLDGWDEPDIQTRETFELLAAMRSWVRAGRPPSFT